jgi:hypothetical protein
MRIIVYYYQNGYLYSSNSGKSQDALKMIIEDSSYNDLGNEPTIQSFYHLDHAVANICKGFTEQEIRRLWIHSTDSEDKVEHGRVWKKIDDINYEFKYFPKTLFTVEKKAGDYPFAIVSDMTQYMVTKIEPDLKDGEIYGRLSIAEQIARSVYNSLIKLGLSPKSLVSPITAYKDIIKAMNLPTWQDVPDEANQYYYNTCTGGWIETYKTGHWDKLWDWDGRSMYPSKMRNLIDFRKGTWEKVDSVPDHKAGMLGVFNCTAEVEADLHCIVYRDEREYNFNPNGTYDTIITWNKLNYAHFHEWGKFHVKDGWVWTPKDGVVCYPLRKKMDELFKLKGEAETDTDRMVIKRIMNAYEGKMCERIFYERNGKMSDTTFGEVFNPCWRSEVENNTHLSVVNFCIENNIKPIAIMTDGVVTDVDLKIPSSTAMGGWKLDSVTKGLVMGSGILALQGKHKEGDFSLNYDVLMEKIDPQSTEIVLEKDGFVSIGEACERNLFAKLGDYEVDKRVIKLNSDTKRIYPNEPANFGELLEHTYDSIPIDISMIGGV